MHRATIALDDEFVAELDRVILERGYQNRSEAIRDLARAGMRQAAEDSKVTGDCVAALVYVYDHDSRELAKRLLNRLFRLGVDAAGRLVENQDLRIVEQRPRDRNPLPLSARQPFAAFTDL